MKEVEFREGEIGIKFDTKITKELEAEGYAREISRRVQVERKKANLGKDDVIKSLTLVTDKELQKLLEEYTKWIKERVNALEIKLKSFDDVSGKSEDGMIEIIIRDKKIKISFQCED